MSKTLFLLLGLMAGNYAMCMEVSEKGGSGQGSYLDPSRLPVELRDRIYLLRQIGQIREIENAFDELAVGENTSNPFYYLFPERAQAPLKEEENRMRKIIDLIALLNISSKDVWLKKEYLNRLAKAMFIRTKGKLQMNEEAYRSMIDPMQDLSGQELSEFKKAATEFDVSVNDVFTYGISPKSKDLEKILRKSKTLDLRGLRINNLSGLKQLSIGNVLNMEQLDLSDNNLDIGNREELIEMSNWLPQLRRIWLNGNPINEDEDAMSELRGLLPPRIQVLRYSAIKLGPGD